MYKLTLAALLFLIPVILPGSAHAQLLGIIAEYCVEFEELSNEVRAELGDSVIDVVDCFDDFDRCQARARNGRQSGRCIQDLGHCLSRENRDQQEACREFMRGYEDAFEDAARQARRNRVQDEFLESEKVLEKTAEALQIAALCAGLVAD